MYPRKKNDANPNVLTPSELHSINSWISIMKKWENRTNSAKVNMARRTLRLRYRFLGHGYTRIVFDMGNNYVLKVAISDLGLKSNKTEFEIFTNSPPDIKKHLCPVLQYGHGWIIMKKISAKVPSNKQFDNQILQLQNKFISHGIIPNDFKKANLALSKKQTLTVIDYGSFIQK
ncbi:hypothetical protein KIS4809_0334 [Bacillus sp. ZZV12-4809]|nr:hypothetical protein KIS4809_0334 [Bacillus sp. ZZV12-4809]